MGKIIINNKTDMPDSTALLYASKAMGRKIYPALFGMDARVDKTKNKISETYTVYRGRSK